MMNYFCEVGTAWQVIQLVLSLLTVITLTVGCAFWFKHRHNVGHQLGMIAVLLMNTALYVLMQIDSRITGAEHTVHLPYVAVLVVTLLSLGLAVRSILRQTKKQKKHKQCIH